uniref:Uncharacterized protein n=1 Tax=Macrostomum lignano TaxID=282301 RepID=A0A1I8FRT6_9PLAT
MVVSLRQRKRTSWCGVAELNAICLHQQRRRIHRCRKRFEAVHIGCTTAFSLLTRSRGREAGQKLRLIAEVLAPLGGRTQTPAPRPRLTWTCRRLHYGRRVGTSDAVRVGFDDDCDEDTERIRHQTLLCASC